MKTAERPINPRRTRARCSRRAAAGLPKAFRIAQHRRACQRRGSAARGYGGLLSAYRLQATAVEFQQMGGVILGLVGRTGTLEADSGPSGLAVAGCHGDEFHEVESDVFIAAGAQGKNGHFHDENSWLKGAVRWFSRPCRDHSRTIAESISLGVRCG